MDIIRFEKSHTKEIINLFYETVYSINSKDYSLLQLNAWAPIEEKQSKLDAWEKTLSQNISLVAKLDNIIVGFSDLEHSGYLNRLYIHKYYQRKGIATSLLNMIEYEARKKNILKINTESSITAKPFFQNHGYKTICSQLIKRQNIMLTNFRMFKEL